MWGERFMKFLLIYGTEMTNPTIHKQKVELTSLVYPPLGLLYVGRSLEDEGHQVEILDLFVEKLAPEDITRHLSTIDAVGISVDNDAYNESAFVARTIKQNDPTLPIILGGPHCTLYPHDSLVNLPDADISVSGDGEHVVKEIARALTGTKKYSQIAGIHYKENNTIQTGLPAQLIEDLDSIPFPSRHLVDQYEYGKLGRTFFYRPKLTSMVTTRGCPYRCRYCLRHILSCEKFRQRSAQNVLAELREINGSYGSVMIGDDTFLADKKRAHAIFDGLIEMKADLNILIGGARVDSADKELYTKMKKAGVTHINYGIESGNQDVLDFYNKHATVQQIKDAVHLANDMNFFITGTFILGAPMETRKHIERTIGFACSLPLDIVVFYPLSYRHGSDLWYDAVKKGLIKENEHEILADSARGLSYFTKDEILQFCAQGLRRFYLRPRYFTHELIKALRTNDFGLLKTGMESLINTII